MVRSLAGNIRATALGVNATAILAARVVTAVGNLVLAVLVADRLGSGGFGSFAALLAGTTLANLVITFGVDLVVVRAVAEEQPEAAGTVRQALILQLLGAGGVFIAAAAMVVLASAAPVLILAAAALFPMGCTTVASAVLRGAKRMTPILAAAALGSLTALAGTWIFLTDRVLVAVAAVVAGHVVSAVFLVANAAHHVPRLGIGASSGLDRTGDTTRTTLRGLTSESWVFALATVSTAVMLQGALVIFEAIASGDAGGLAAGVRLAETARMVPAAAFAALFPAMFQGVHQSPKYKKLFLAIVLYAVIAIGVIVLLAPWLAESVFGDPPDGAIAVRILAVGLLVTVFRLRFSFELIADHRERTVLIAAVSATMLAVAGFVIGSLLDSVVFVAVSQVGAAALNAVVLGLANQRTAAAKSPISTV